VMARKVELMQQAHVTGVASGCCCWRGHWNQRDLHVISADRTVGSSTSIRFVSPEPLVLRTGWNHTNVWTSSDGIGRRVLDSLAPDLLKVFYKVRRGR
jgi:hypothetical protein